MHALDDKGLQLLCELLMEMLETGRIGRLKSSGAASLFVPRNLGRRLRDFVDYQGLNLVIKPNRYSYY